MKRTHTIIEHDSTEEEWKELMQLLEQLSNEEIKQIADICNISFITTTEATKDDYINILDETYWDTLAQAYEQVTGRNFN